MQSFTGVVESYPIIFGTKDETNEPDGEESNQRVTGGRLERMYGWISLIDGLANGDMTQWKYFEEMNCIEALNMVQYRIVKNEDELARKKK